MALVEVDDPHSFGIVEVAGGKVKKLVEKPTKPKSHLANGGVYVFDQSIFQHLKEIDRSSRDEYELTDAIKRMIKEGDVGGFKIKKGQWIDVGLPWNLLDANEVVMGVIELKKDKTAII
jgi:bifunctional UDP-N-acetylglucosamine pyrophosphorylase/glucosamine-1-phosphate N-acetyltransferase